MSADHSTHTQIEMGSERGFGIVFACVFIIIAVYPFFWGNPIRLWALTLSGLFAIIAFVNPSILRPLNLLWFKIGLLLGKIFTPVVMALLFVTTFVPVSIYLKIFGRDNMRLKIDKGEGTYWIIRSNIGNDNSNFKNQF